MKIPYYLVNSIFLSGAAAAYMNNRMVSVVLGAGAWLAFPVLMFVFGADPLNAALPIIVFDGLIFAFSQSRNSILQNVLKWGGLFCREECRKKALMEDSLRLESFENGMKFKELEIVKLYDITKKMSEGLRLEDILESLGSFLRENFEFRRLELLVLRQEPGGARLEGSHEVWKDPLYHSALQASGTGQAPDHPAFQVPTGKLDYDNLIKFFTENPKEHFIPGNEGRSLAGVPLLSEKAVSGILLIEDLPKKDLEKFVILSMQFALEMKKALLYETVERLAITDSLTGLFLRRYFSERLEEEMARSARHSLRFALLLIDIDDFKKCNDAHGHLAGDAALKETARLIKEGVREIDIVSRYGGEEFAVLLEETDGKGAMIVAERIRKKVEEHRFRVYDESLKITVSIGMSVFPKDGGGAKGLFKKADRALYEAKKSGKNVVRRFGV
jgi:diguanylate cyclase (GGDEF)-like protein